jgi:hypothetical protein
VTQPETSQARCHILWLRDETKFYYETQHLPYHNRLSLNVKIYEKRFRSSVYGGKSIHKVYNVTTKPTCLVLIIMNLTSLDVARHFLCAAGTKCDYQNSKANSWAVSGKLVLLAQFMTLQSSNSPRLLCDRCTFSSCEKLVASQNHFVITGNHIFWLLIIIADLFCPVISFYLQYFFSSVLCYCWQNYWCAWSTMYWEIMGVRILTETNHQESGQKIRRDTKLMLLAGDIACRWRCWMELKGGQWNPNLSAVKQ